MTTELNKIYKNNRLLPDLNKILSIFSFENRFVFYTLGACFVITA